MLAAGLQGLEVRNQLARRLEEQQATEEMLQAQLDEQEAKVDLLIPMPVLLGCC